MGGFYGCCGDGVEKRLRVCFAASLLRCLAVFQIPYLFEETGILTHQQSASSELMTKVPPPLSDFRSTGTPTKKPNNNDVARNEVTK
jgi:hypothetical protein